MRMVTERVVQKWRDMRFSAKLVPVAETSLEKVRHTM
jgi:hypothetical protein